MRPWSPLVALAFWGVLGLAWTGGGQVFTTFSAAARAPGPMPREVPNLRFVDDAGDARELSRLPPRWTLVFFMYLRCPNVCHLGLANLRDAARKLAPIYGERLGFYGLSFDGDSPERLAAMRDALRVPESVRLGSLALAVPPESDEELARFGVVVRRRADGLFNHTTSFFLLDEQHRLVAVIAPERPELVVRAVQEALR